MSAKCTFPSEKNSGYFVPLIPPVTGGQLSVTELCQSRVVYNLRRSLVQKTPIPQLSCTSGKFYFRLSIWRETSFFFFSAENEDNSDQVNGKFDKEESSTMVSLALSKTCVTISRDFSLTRASKVLFWFSLCLNICQTISADKSADWSVRFCVLRIKQVSSVISPSPGQILVLLTPLCVPLVHI